MDRLLFSLLSAPFVFAAIAAFSRAPQRRILAALAAGIAFGLGNIAWDIFAVRMGFWRYPGSESHAPLLWYGATALSAGGVSLLGWRFRRARGSRGMMFFLFGFAILCPLRDAQVASSDDPIIRFGSGTAPWVADGVGAFILMSIALVVQTALAGPDVLREPARSS